MVLPLAGERFLSSGWWWGSRAPELRLSAKDSFSSRTPKLLTATTRSSSSTHDYLVLKFSCRFRGLLLLLKFSSLLLFVKFSSLFRWVCSLISFSLIVFERFCCLCSQISGPLRAVSFLSSKSLVSFERFAPGSQLA